MSMVNRENPHDSSLWIRDCYFLKAVYKNACLEFMFHAALLYLMLHGCANSSCNSCTLFL